MESEEAVACFKIEGESSNLFLTQKAVELAQPSLDPALDYDWEVG